MTSPYVLATLLFYSVSLALYVWNLREPSRMAGIGATVCLIGALGLHYLALLERSRLIHAVPYDDLFGSLSLFAWLLALHPFAAGRTYAAYGGVYVSVAVLWLWLIERQRPDRWDLLGVAMALGGMVVIVAAHRGS